MSSAAAASALILLALLMILPPRGRGLHRLATSRPLPASPDGIAARRRLLSIGSTDLARATRRRLAALVAIFGGIGLALSLGASVVVSAATLAVITAVILWQRSKHRHRTAAAARRTQIIEACDLLSADLTAGRPPAEALEGAATICPDLQIASAACRLGGDVPATLDLAAESPGAEGLRALASAWRVADESGAAFAAIVDRLANSLRADEAIRRQTAASLAGARATARLLAVLPLFGAALGYALGANPLAFLTATPIGWIALTTGLTLSITGLAWTDHLAEERTP